MSPLLLLADSQLLFRPDQLPQLLRHCSGQERSTAKPLSAAYIGAANGNRPEFYDLARSALATLFGQPVPCHFIQSESDIPPGPCALVILAGGRVETGWAFLQQQPVRDWLETCRSEADAVFIGVSAGAIHLASGCDPEQPSPRAQTYLGWAPLFVAVHEEGENWPTARIWREAKSLQASGILTFAGVPMGGGLWLDDGGCEPVGREGPLFYKP